MTATTVSTHPEVQTPAEVRRARILAVVYVGLALFTAFVFGVGGEG